ncbi:MAG: RNA polymerase subunit sigma-70 [Gallintestinimicrobium sp.]
MCAGPGDRTGHPGIKEKAQDNHPDECKREQSDFPYQPQHFKIEGTTFTYADDSALRWDEGLLERRKANAEKIKLNVEEWMLTIPARMQRIIRWKFLEELTWEEVAVKMGRKATGDSVRLEFQRFMAEK